MEVILLSDHQGEKLVSVNGHLYVHHSTSGQAIVWRCKERASKGCPARLRTSVQLTNPVTVNSHTHDPNEVDTAAILRLTQNYVGGKQELKSGEDELISYSATGAANIEPNTLSTSASGATATASHTLTVSDDAVPKYFSDYSISDNELINSGYVSGEYGGALDPDYENDYIDPNDPPYEEEEHVPARKRTSEEPRRKRRIKKVTVGLSKPQSADESETSKPQEFSLLSGLFGGETKKKRKKKPNTLKGPTSKDMPPEPRYVSDIRLEGIWTVTDSTNPQRFLLYDNHEDNPERRVVLFMTDDHLRILMTTNRVHMESSAPVPPTIFAQLYLIQASLVDSNHIVTLGYAFMGSRLEQSYVEVFQAILSKAKDLNLPPISFQTGTVFLDYEKPAINALKRVFGSNIRIEGRFFHLNRIVWKKIQNLDLVVACQVSEDFKLYVAQLVCLAFLPTEDVRQGMLHLKQTAPGGSETAKIDLLLDWFDSTFVSGAVKATRITHSAKSKGISKMLASHITTGAAAATETIELHQNNAPFPPEKWNFHDAIVSASTRSDNLLEGSYWTIKHLIGHNRPSFYRAIKYLRMEENWATKRIEDHEHGRLLLPRITKKNLLQMQDKISRYCVSYREGDIDMSTFLMAVAKTIRLGEM